MSRAIHAAVLVAIAVILPLGPSAAAETPAPITIKVQGGATYTGLVDSQTDDRRLRLRFEEGRAVAWRSFSWPRIVAAWHEGRSVAIADLPNLARTIQTTHQRAAAPRHRDPVPPMPKPQTAAAALAIDAALGNWDADVETDGLALELRVLDADGETTVAAGTLEVELFAPRIRKYHEAPQSRGYYVDLIERWNVPIDKQQFRGGRAVVRLPFGAIHPEFDRGVDMLGLIHVRLAVPGTGVLEQSLDGVVLRPWSPTRDALLDNTGRRFLPTEATGRGEGAYPLPRY